MNTPSRYRISLLAQKVPLGPFALIPAQLYPRKPLIYCHDRLALPFLEFLVNGLIQDVLFFHQHSVFKSFIVVVCISVVCYILIAEECYLGYTVWI